MKRYQKIIIIILVPIVIYFSAISVLKWQSAPYPDVYNMLVNESCTTIITNEDGSISKKERLDGDSSVFGYNVVWFYKVIKVINKEKYEIKYWLNDNGNNMIYGVNGHSMEIEVRLSGLKVNDLKIFVKYSDFYGTTKKELYNGFSENNYSAFKYQLSNDVDSCKNI